MLAVHSASGFSGYAASDRVPDKIAAIVYVDTAPGKRALDPEFEGDESRWSGTRSRPRRTSTGLTEEQMATFRERAVPVPGGILRGRPRVHERRPPRHPDDAHRDRLHVADYQKYAKENPDWAFLAGLPELRNVTWIDLPTSHWPMWSKPAEIAEIIGDVAMKAGRSSETADAAR